MVHLLEKLNSVICEAKHTLTIRLGNENTQLSMRTLLRTAKQLNLPSVQTLAYPHRKILLCNMKDTMCTIAWGNPQISTHTATDSKPKQLHTSVSFSIKCYTRQDSGSRSRFPVSSNQSRRHSPEAQRNCNEVNSYRRNCSKQTQANLPDAKSWLWH